MGEELKPGDQPRVEEAHQAACDYRKEESFGPALRALVRQATVSDGGEHHGADNQGHATEQHRRIAFRCPDVALDRADHQRQPHAHRESHAHTGGVDAHHQ